VSDGARDLIRARLLHEREVAQRRASEPRQEPLPFDGDGSFLADETPEFHGTTVGVSRHAAAGEKLCAPCRDWMETLVDAGLAVRLDEQPACDQ
jgi:hypothetical protein